MKIIGLQSQTPTPVERSVRLALFEPDIAQNAGAIVRLGACFGAGVDVIEPCGFVWSDRHFKRSAMDYRELTAMTRHLDYRTFRAAHPNRRVVLLTTKASVPHHRFSFQPDDILLLGRESAGVPAYVDAGADARIRISMQPGARSLNVAQTAAIALTEALRQLGILDTLS